MLGDALVGVPGGASCDIVDCGDDYCAWLVDGVCGV